MAFEIDKAGNINVQPLLSFDTAAVFNVVLLRLEAISTPAERKKSALALQVSMTETQCVELIADLSEKLAAIRQAPGRTPVN